MSSRKRSSRTRVLPTVFGVIVVIALIAVAGEIGVRSYISSQISDAFRTAATERGATEPEDVSVSYGSRPVLLALLTKSHPQVDLTTPNTLLVENPAAASGEPKIVGDPSAEIHMTDVDLSNSNDPVASSVRIFVTLPPELIQALINRQTGLRVTSLQPLPAEGLFNVEFSSGFVSSKVRPKADGGRIEIGLEGGSLLNLNLDGLARWIGQATEDLLSYQIGHGLRVEDATVTDQGLALTLAAENLALSTARDITFH